MLKKIALCYLIVSFIVVITTVVVFTTIAAFSEWGWKGAIFINWLWLLLVAMLISEV